MNLNIKRRITAINNEPAVRTFFRLLREFIKALDITPEKEKVAFTVRNNDRKRISINLNSRLVLFIKNGGLIGLMVNQEDVPTIAALANIVDQDFFKDQGQKTVLLYLNFEDILPHIEIIQPLWLKSCKDYEAVQQKTQYRKFHVSEIYDLAMNEALLTPYFDNSIITKNIFPNIINELRDYLKGEDNVLSEFKIRPIKGNSYWVWVIDNHDAIGVANAHYEIAKKKNNLHTYIHFEGKSKEERDVYSDRIKTLPEHAEWIEWRDSKSIRHREAIDIDDPDVVEKLSAQLLYLEEQLGDEIRKLLVNLDIPSTNKKTNMSEPLNQILFGPPGTGKTFNTINKALKIINEKEEQSLNWSDRAAVKKLFNQRIEEERIVFTTFHQSMSYEDFVEGIKPQEPKEEGQAITYIVEDGIFKTLSNAADSRKGNFLQVLESFKTELFEGDNKTPLTIKASGSTFDVIYKGGTVFYVSPHNSSKKDPSYPVSISNIEKYFNTDSLDGIYNQTYVKGILEFLLSNRGLKKGKNLDIIEKKFVLIIDEINRGNVSQIFGELITLIEEDKRLGKEEELQVTLPYSKEKFGVPSNLYILGTMNTADRSVEALDAALRRRFSFEEMPPRPELITLNGKIENGMVEGIKLAELLKTINLRIEKLLDKDHLIGHSYFMAVKDLEDLKSAFQHKIIPLLQEYFFGDYGKIGLLLGQGFFEPVQDEQNIFADFEGYDAVDFSERTIYRLKDFTNQSEEEGKNDETFIQAIHTLLKK